MNHELRHTAATTWLSLGLPMEYVRRQMGHRPITTTINSYGHLERTMMPDAAGRVEAALLGETWYHGGTTAPDSLDTPEAKTAR